MEFKRYDIPNRGSGEIALSVITSNYEEYREVLVKTNKKDGMGYYYINGYRGLRLN